MEARPKISISGIAGITLGLLLMVLALSAACWKTFLMGDDFSTPMFWSLLVERHGLGHLLVPPQAMRYRPIEAIVMYLFQAAPVGDLLARVHVLHYVSFGAYVFFVMWFGRAIGLTRTAVVVAGIVSALHPVQIACYGGLDNFSVHALVAVMLGGMTLLMRYADRPVAVALIAFFTTLVSSCFKEYGFGTFFFAPLVVWFFGRHRQVRNAGIVAACALLAVVIHQLAKHLLLTDMAQSETPTPFKPVSALLYNIALYSSGSLYFGSTLDLMTRGGIVQKALFGGLVMLLLAFLAVGLWRIVMRNRSGDDAGSANPRRQLIFLCLMLVPMTMPNLVLLRISEVYLPGVVAVLSMMMGMAFVGWQTSGAKPLRWTGAGLLVVLLGFACAATIGKAQALARVGESSRKMLDTLDQAVPGEMRRGTVALVFPAEASKSYSVYKATDIALLNEIALQWKRHDSEVMLVRLTQSDAPSAADDAQYDLVLQWSPEQESFTVIKALAR